MALGDLMVSRFSYASDVVSNHLDVSSNQQDLGFQTRLRDSDSGSNDNGDATGAQFLFNMYLSQNMALRGDHHDAFEAYVRTGPSESGMVSKWRPKERMKTGSVALVLCLNISVDPQDVIKISPCARMECWIDPFSMVPQRALETIGKALSIQYERWQPRARYKIQLDPTVEEIKKLCISCRKSAKAERVLFHYNGHGVLKPTINGEIWMFNKSYTMYIPLPISDLDSWLKTPSIYVFDCSAAGMVVDAFMALNDGNTPNKVGSTRDCILLAACESHETLPQSAEYPADVFTSCLTTPIKMALRWCHRRSLLRDSITITQIDKIPGRQNDRKTLLGELNWIFTAITDTIAWNVLPHDLFQRLFRQDLLVASLFRNFLLAERIMRSANCSPISHPILPPTHQHHMWDAWDMAAELCISQLPNLLDDPNAEFQPSPFFTEQLTAFEVWLDHGSVHKKPPEQLPIVLQVLLSQCHRFRAMVLLGKFLDIGPWAVDLALSVGIFPYVLKLLQTTTPELRHILVFIWTKILSVDKSCQVDLVKDGGHTYFIRFLDSNDSYPEQRAMAAFVLAVIADGHRRGQETCVESGLINVCLGYLKSANQDTQTAPIFLQWVSLCLGKIWEDYSDAQLIGIQEDAPSVFSSLLSEPQPEVRASAIFALGTLLDTGFDSSRDCIGEDELDGELRFKAEVDILKILLGVFSDGSPIVRFEVSVALARFAFCHNKQLKSVASTCRKTQSNSLLSSFSLVNIKGTSTEYMSPNQSMSHAAIIPSQIGPLSRLSNDNPSIIRDVRVSTSSPLSAPGIMHGSPLSDASSMHSDAGTSTDIGGGVVNHFRHIPLDNTLCSQCVSAMSTLSKDPSPRVASLGRHVLSIIGIEQVLSRPVRTVRPGDSTVALTSPSLAGLARSSSWLDINTGQFPMAFRTPPVSPPRRSYLTGMRRVCSLEFRPHNMNSMDSGLADPFLGAIGPSGISERSFLPQANIYNWSCGYFSKPLLNSADDSEDVSARREKKEELAVNFIAKCQRNSVRKFGSQIAFCDTKFEGGTKAALMQPFSPIVIATDDNERIMVWNYEETTLLNSFDNHNFPDKGISTLCLVNELDDSLLLVCSYDGSIRIWKDYTIKGTHKLVTAFSSIQGPKHGTQNIDAVVDWQQHSGYLYAAGEMPSIMLWDLDKEKLLNSIPSSSECGVSALSASQVHEGQFAAGFTDGSVRLFDVRTPEMVIFTMRPHEQRSVGIGFQPGFDAIKIVSASPAGDIQLLDIRNGERAYQTISAHRGSLTALAVHRHAPLIASGSANQRIKVLNLEGNTLSTIQYHPTFMGQRIGSVRCLSFHPYQIRLAAGAADAFLTIYADDMSNVS